MLDISGSIKYVSTRRIKTKKNPQVSIMAEIYNGAIGVIVWLGLSNEYTDTMSWLFDRLSNHMQFLDNRRSVVPSELSRAKMLAHDAILEYSRMVGSDPRSRTWLVRITGELSDAVEHFYSNPYWHRIWIAQEVILGRSLTVQQGHYQIPFMTMDAALRMINMGSIPNRMHTPLKIDFIIKSRAYLGIHPTSQFPTGDRGALLSKTVLMLSSAHCTEPKDYIYGLQAFIRSTSRVQVDCR
jgi:hypothetical protein